MKKRVLSGIGLVGLILIVGAAIRAQDNAGKEPPRTPAAAISVNWNDIGGRLVAMAEDFPEDKYDYRPNDQVRTFASVLRHVAGSNFGLVNQLEGKKVGNGENDPSATEFKTKGQIVDFLKKSVDEGASVLKSQGDQAALKHLADWIGYTEHMGEHYGQLVVYYRNNGMVPPESRPKKK